MGKGERQAGYELRLESWSAPEVMSAAQIVARISPQGLGNVCMTLQTGSRQGGDPGLPRPGLPLAGGLQGLSAGALAEETPAAWQHAGRAFHSAGQNELDRVSKARGHGEEIGGAHKPMPGHVHDSLLQALDK